jgi:outer membrane protein
MPRIASVTAAILFTSASVFAQNGQLNVAGAIQAAATQSAARPQTEIVKPLSIDEAMRLALEQNLGLRIQRIDPEISDVGISQARSFWSPQLSTTFSKQSQTNAATSSLAGAATSIDNGTVASTIGVQQTLPTGAFYQVNWNNARFTSTNLFNNFSPQLSSNLNFQVTQPLLRNFSIDQIRQQVLDSKKFRELSDIQLDAAITQTLRNVKNAYWDLSFAIDNLKTQQESLRLAQQSLRDNQKRVEIGTMAPIDIVQAQAEVASNEERVIVAEAAIKRAQDVLRTLVLDPATPGFWTTTFEPTDAAPFNDRAIDVDAAVANAMDKRSDLRSAKNSIERSDIDIRYLRNQILPDVNAQAVYISRGIGGTQLNALTPDDVLSGNVDRRVTAQRGFGSVLGDLFQNQFPDWTIGVQINYPLGTNTAHANLARAKLQYQQTITQLESLKMIVATQVRDAARNVQTNQKRVQSARASRELQEKKLEAEEKKLAAGMSSSFFVFQAQRDLAQARTAEIQAISDYNKSIVDFETVQVAPLNGATGVIPSAGAGTLQSGSSAIVRGQ